MTTESHDPPDSGAHRVRWMFHSTAMVADYDLACQRLARLAGLRVLECNSMEEIGRRGGMTWLGDNSLEIGDPLRPSTATGRFVRDHGGGVHSIALDVADIDATIAHVEAEGVRIAARPTPDFCFSDPRDTRGVFIQWAHIEVPEDPRSGAAMPPHSVDPVLEVARQAYVGAVVEDPVETAASLARLAGTRVTFENPGAAARVPWSGVSLGDCTLALFPLPEEDDSVWGRAYLRPRTHLIALSVEDLRRSAAQAADAGFGAVAEDESIVVIDPASTGGVQVALVDALLPGDPRS